MKNNTMSNITFGSLVAFFLAIAIAFIGIMAYTFNRTSTNAYAVTSFKNARLDAQARYGDMWERVKLIQYDRRNNVIYAGTIDDDIILHPEKDEVAKGLPVAIALPHGSIAERPVPAPEHSPEVGHSPKVYELP